MTGAERARIQSLLGGEEFARLFAAVRRRLERAGDGQVRSVTLRGMSHKEREGIAGLLGLARLPDPSLRLDLARLDESLRASNAGVGLRTAIEALGDPLRDLRAERRRAEEQERRLWRRAEQHPAVLGRPALAAWLDELQAEGRLARAASAAGIEPERLLAQSLDVVERLPAGGVGLSALAAELTGDAHGLDPGRPLAGLVLRAGLRLAGWQAMPKAASGRRRLWAELGVLCDPVSSQVLVLGLRPTGDAMLARHLRDAAGAGQPRRITLREIQSEPLRVEPGTLLFVCENPAVVTAAADELASRCAALVCLEGQPSTAAMTLLSDLAGQGARIRFQCDFDWAGVRIGNQLAAIPNAAPWAFREQDYRAAIAGTPAARPLRGDPVEPRWDPGLGAAMRGLGLALYEEQIQSDLLGALDPQ